jgi:hypothetical protein
MTCPGANIPDLNRPIDAEMIRQFMAAEGPELTTLGFDLEFSPEEIAGAMTSAARRYNGIPPFIGAADPNALPAQTNIFFDGIAYELYALQYRKLSKQDIDYSAGGVSANLVTKRLNYITRLMETHRNDFESAARDQKRIRNRNAFFRHY